MHIGPERAFWSFLANLGHSHDHVGNNTPFKLIQLKGMHEVTVIDPFYGPKVDAKPQNQSGGPRNEHKYHRFKGFSTALTNLIFYHLMMDVWIAGWKYILFFDP